MMVQGNDRRVTDRTHRPSRNNKVSKQHSPVVFIIRAVTCEAVWKRNTEAESHQERDGKSPITRVLNGKFIYKWWVSSCVWEMKPLIAACWLCQTGQPSWLSTTPLHHLLMRLARIGVYPRNPWLPDPRIFMSGFIAVLVRVAIGGRPAIFHVASRLKEWRRGEMYSRSWSHHKSTAATAQDLICCHLLTTSSLIICW